MRYLAWCLLTITLPLEARAACDWLARPEAGVHEVISSRLACLSDPYSAACVKFDAVPRKHRETDRLRRIEALGLDDADAGHLRERGIWVGATREMTCLAWGKPHRVEELAADPFGERWFYGEVDVVRFDGKAIVEIRTATQTLGESDD